MNNNFDLEIEKNIISFESKLGDNLYDKQSLINETFFIWYALVEGINCVKFDEKKLEDLLSRNFDIFSTTFKNDPDFCFLMGWIINVAPWYFKSKIIDEEYGLSLLKLAYNNVRNNALYKWAIKNELGLKKQELGDLQSKIKDGFENYFNYSEIIKLYFLDVIS